MARISSTTQALLMIGLGAFLGAYTGALFEVTFLEEAGAAQKQNAPFFGLLAGVCLGLLSGLLNRSVSVFWLYFVVVFGLLTVMPWWESWLGGQRLPLGAVYVSDWPFEPHIHQWFMVLPVHVLISLFLAWNGAAFHPILMQTFWAAGRANSTQTP